MALPLILGLGGSALAGATGANALLYGALGSGLGSLLQGDDLGTAIGTGIMSYFGGKALGGSMLCASLSVESLVRPERALPTWLHDPSSLLWLKSTSTRRFAAFKWTGSSPVS